MNKPADENKNEFGTGTIAALVVLAGGVGGFLSWLFSLVAGQKPIFDSAWAAVPTSLAFGMGASFIGIYVLANSDTRALMRCLALAVLLGFSWKVVWEAGDAFVRQSLTRNEVARDSKELNEEVERLSDFPSLSQDEQTAAIRNTANTAKRILRSSTKLYDKNMVDEAQVQVKSAVAKLEQVASQAPVPAVKALASIGHVAYSTNTEDVASAAVDSLRTVASANPGVEKTALVYRHLQSFPLLGDVSDSSLGDKVRENRAMVAIELADQSKKQGPAVITEDWLPIIEDLSTAKRMYVKAGQPDDVKKTEKLIEEFGPQIMAFEPSLRRTDGT